MGIFGRQPLVSYALAALMLVAFGYLNFVDEHESAEASVVLEQARDFYEQNPWVDVDARSRELLGRAFVQLIERAYAEEVEGGAAAPAPSSRRLERAQSRFDSLCDEAFWGQLAERPSWRYGVLVQGGSLRSYVTHAFVNDGALALLVSVGFLLMAGVGLERAWGSAVFALVCLLGTIGPGVSFMLFDRSSELPFSGGSGLVALLLGGYTVRAFTGRMPLPVWMLLPGWVLAEYILVRDASIDGLDTAPLVTHAAALVAGAVVAGVIQLLGLSRADESSDEQIDSILDGSVLKRAQLAEEGGNHIEALVMLQKANARAPEDEATALAYWNLARKHGRAVEAAAVLLPIIRDQVRRGDDAAAIEHWCELMDEAEDVEIEATLCVRMGERLLEDGKMQLCLDALRHALSQPRGLSPAVAQRIVRIARDLDPVLTRQAADVALREDQLDPVARADLEEIVREPASLLPPSEAAEPIASSPELSARDARATTQETTEYPIDADIDLNPEGELTEPGALESIGLDAAPDGTLADADEADMDPNALSIESLEREFSGEFLLSDEDVAAETLDADAGHEPQAEAPAHFDRPGLDESCLDNSHLDAGALSPDALAGDGSITEPLMSGPDAPLASAPLAPAPQAVEAQDPPRLRALKVVDAVPLSMKEQAIEVGVEGRGTNKIPFDRIEGVAVAAVSGISDRPVLVIDLVLNWIASSDETLKAVRFCSHQFNPATFFSGSGSQTEALQQMIAALLERSQATPLPHASAAAGSPFERYDDVASYERAVLGCGVAEAD
jgi:membrane associated rhomboid family serine protease